MKFKKLKFFNTINKKLIKIKKNLPRERPSHVWCICRLTADRKELVKFLPNEALNSLTRTSLQLLSFPRLCHLIKISSVDSHAPSSLETPLCSVESDSATQLQKPRKMLKNHQELPMKAPREKHSFAYACYRCNKLGHFIKDCPEITHKRSPISQRPSSSSSTTTDLEFPTTYCRCGVGLCEIRVSMSSSNPGRKYYRCPGKYVCNFFFLFWALFFGSIWSCFRMITLWMILFYFGFLQDKHCGYFKWCDELREDEIRKSQPEVNFPTCKCGAGVCIVRVEESGPNADRSYFACPIKKVINCALWRSICLVWCGSFVV